MPRLTILAKGNADVRNSLHALVEDGRVAWNGLGEVVRERCPGWHVRVVHETMTRSDAVLAAAGADGRVPAALAAADLPLGPYWPDSQFATRLFAGGLDAVVLSIQPDVMNRLARHRGDGHLLYPHEAARWPAAARARLAAEYEVLPPLAPEQSMANLAAIAAHVTAPMLVCNLSPVLPWERVHCYRGLGETLGERIRRFNLALVALSRETGIAVVDVDAIVARGGADRLKRDVVTLTAEGCALVAAEVARILAAEGRFAREAAA